MAQLKSTTISGTLEVSQNAKASGYNHSSHNNNDAVLLAGGGWKALSDITASIGSDYLPLAGGRMKGSINFGESGVNKPAINFRENYNVNPSSSPTGRYNCGFFYDTASYESLILCLQEANQRFGVINGINLREKTYNSSSSDTYGLIVINNKVGINKSYSYGSSPSYTLEVGGTVSGASFYAYSDKRLKINIKPAQLNYSDIIKQIKLYEFDWKKDQKPNQRNFGTIAQELQKILPQELQDFFVSSDESKEKILAINDSKLIYLVIGALQEQLMINQDLTNRLTILEEKNNE